MNIPIALHEAAHHIAGSILPEKLEDHGPEWLGIYVYLLNANGIGSRRAIKTSLQSMNLKWYSLKKIMKLSADFKATLKV